MSKSKAYFRRSRTAWRCAAHRDEHRRVRETNLAHVCAPQAHDGQQRRQGSMCGSDLTVVASLPPHARTYTSMLECAAHLAPAPFWHGPCHRSALGMQRAPIHVMPSPACHQKRQCCLLHKRCVSRWTCAPQRHPLELSGRAAWRCHSPVVLGHCYKLGRRIMVSKLQSQRLFVFVSGTLCKLIGSSPRLPACRSARHSSTARRTRAVLRTAAARRAQWVRVLRQILEARPTI